MSDVPATVCDTVTVVSAPAGTAPTTNAATTTSEASELQRASLFMILLLP
jgi:hypothetical protein